MTGHAPVQLDVESGERRDRERRLTVPHGELLLDDHLVDKHESGDFQDVAIHDAQFTDL